ncbi:hypothetical protein Asppvi_009387 [Aspergillus pseudoviridinutans]|uniref:MGS207 protein n=1 Tax=Aspergillus pseudoviridinutans TaxID=1517512 RepID=A0A9P3BK59_9EURO|nr:uncharacterized protein Asppvi_009387 [Aspergillus pseudoviridinutans]GIJ90433.1 hypothetical protein Asppvi_009387 [Aspergillus pseudoviridinutans]
MDEAPPLVRLPSRTLPPVLKPVFTLEGHDDERATTLRRLLEKGHVSVAPLREPKLILHSHLPHLLGSAYLLGASSTLLEELYEHEVSTLVQVDDSFIRGDAITRENWRDFLTQKSYTVAYVDFFDKEIERQNGDWRQVLKSYLFSGPEPLINGYAGGLGHPFIHLAYSWELQSPTVASEALSLGCTEYFGVHHLLDQYPPDNSTYKTTSLADVIHRIYKDKRFDNLFQEQGITNIEVLLQKRYEAVLEHWNAWHVSDSLAQLEHCCDVSVLLAIATGNREAKYDFYLVHTMTVAHALRVLWDQFPTEQRICILRQYALFLILVYICQKKPAFEANIIDKILSVDLGGQDWESVRAEALGHRWLKDSHFFKVVRAPMAFEETYGKKDNFYLKASAKFIAEFDGWEGFGLGVEGFLPNRDGYKPT